MSYEVQGILEEWTVFKGPLVCLTAHLLAAGTAASLAINHGDLQAGKCRASTVDQRPKRWRVDIKARVETRRAVSKRKCSANHRLSADHSLRSTTS